MRGLVHEDFWHNVLDHQMQDNVVEDKLLIKVPMLHFQLSKEIRSVVHLRQMKLLVALVVNQDNDAINHFTCMISNLMGNDDLDFIACA
jgi:hypothetical protein